MKLYSVAAFCFFIASASAQAKGWERLPDGRVVIEVYGVKLAFPENTTTPFEIISDDKRAREAIPVEPFSGGVKISDVIKHPNETRAALDFAKADGRSMVRIPLGDIKVIIDGKARLLRGYAGDIDVFYPPKAGWVESLKSQCVRVDSAKNGPIIADKVQGKFVLGGVDKSTNSEGLCIPSEKRKFASKYSLGIGCSKINIPKCSRHFLSKHAELRVEYRFLPDFPYDGKEKRIQKFGDYHFPMIEWEELDHELLKYFQAIVLNKELLP